MVGASRVGRSRHRLVAGAAGDRALDACGPQENVTGSANRDGSFLGQCDQVMIVSRSSLSVPGCRAKKALQRPLYAAWVLKLAFPHDEGLPAHLAEARSVPGVSDPILLELWHPVVGTGSRDGRKPTSGMRMPKTSVQPDRLPTCREYEVRCAWQCPHMLSEPVSHGMGQRSERPLRRGVLAAIGPHRASDRFRDIVPDRWALNLQEWYRSRRCIALERLRVRPRWLARL